MATVTEDLVNGHNLREVLGGFDVDRIFRITGLVASPHLQLIEAAQTGGVPVLLEPYDAAWLGLVCVTRDFVPDGPNAARADIGFSTRPNVSTYNQPPIDPNTPPGNVFGQNVKQITAGGTERFTFLDNTGSPMVVNPPPSLAGLPGYISEARYLYPSGQIVFERPELTVAVQIMRQYVSSVNQFAIGNYGAKSLLFKQLEAQSDDGGNKWNCTYTFEYSGIGWAHRDGYHAPDGHVPTDATLFEWDLYAEKDFSDLELDFGDGQIPIT